jgi:hypothetical protein
MSEVLALIVVRHLVHDFKLDVSILGEHADRLFRLCAQALWSQSSSRFLIVDARGEVSAVASLSAHDIGGPCILFPLERAVRELESRLIEPEGPSQMHLSLPPVAVMSKLKRGTR